MGQVHDKISQYCRLYNISIVNLCGNKSFVYKFVKDSNTKFDLNNKEIHIFTHNNIYFKDEEDNNE